MKEAHRNTGEARLDLDNIGVLEVYSPARVTQIANSFNLGAGVAMDLKTVCDFTKHAKTSDSQNAR